MANLSSFLSPPPKSQGNRPITTKAGSNGFWRRKGFLLPGTYKFIVDRSGLHRLSGMSAGSGGRQDNRNNSTRGADPRITQGSGGGLCVGDFEMVKGDVILITLGLPGLGSLVDAIPTDGGTTSIVCAARGINMVIPGGRYGAPNVRPTGGNILNNIGGNGAASPNLLGGCSSGTLLGDGHRSENGGGAGWGGPPTTTSGSGSFDGEVNGYSEYIRARLGQQRDNSWWSFDDFLGYGQSTAAPSGHGAGSAQNSFNDSAPPEEAGAGGGGGAKNNGTGRGGTSFAGGGGGAALGAAGGDGGGPLVTVHWDEVI